ncbi:sugar transporter SWEET1 isoform X3 [Lingula anatina]|uniref:Sugar transporter SWEET n=1 Tax=Lingula anatina TaxID=7574 RepID=A0A1S3KDY7_LINAN|nr:sugar transporter SWEET1 isoform X3 [Lingula anatina]|eukprot:XP_013420838.1 sugar transporter SWEET1 isoform X3 [Lingula anatina]
MGAMLYFETLTLKVVVQWTATLFTFVAFLAGIHSAHKIVKQGNTHEVSLVPYLSFFVGAVVWLKYGTLIHDPTIILVNIVGLCFQTVYIFIYYIYSLQKHFIYKQFAFAAAVVVPTLVYAKYLASSLAKATQVVGLVGCMLSLCSYCSPLATLSTVYMQFAAALAIILPMLAYCHYVAPTTAVAANVVGLIGSGLSIATFASPLATLRTVLKNKSTDSMSFPLVAVNFLVALQWALYGYLLKDKNILIPNTLGCAIAGVQVLLFVVYPPWKSKTHHAPLHGPVIKT